MEWYAPLSILPAIGLIILSTSNFIVALNSELYQLEENKEANKWIITQKLKQLKRLGIAAALLYSSALFFMFATFSQGFGMKEGMFKSLMIIGVSLATIALGFLFVHALRAIKVRHV